jgi:hypothetical protein
MQKTAALLGQQTIATADQLIEALDADVPAPIIRSVTDLDFYEAGIRVGRRQLVDQLITASKRNAPHGR